MAIKDFLQRLLKFGKETGYFSVSPLGKIAKTCCPNAMTEVIDFDRVKDQICQQGQYKSFKSCDALKILPDGHCIDFIELKGFKEFRRRLPANRPAEPLIEAQIERFDLKTKIHDSYVVLYLLLHRKNDLIKEEKTLYPEVNKNYLVLIDLELEENGIQNLAVTLDFLSEASDPIEKQIVSRLTTEIENISFPDLKINQPVLKSCKSIDDYYQNLV